MDIAESLRQAQDAVDEADGLRGAAIKRRDALIIQAREQGVTWKQIEQATGLTPPAIAKAIKRTVGPSS